MLKVGVAVAVSENKTVKFSTSLYSFFDYRTVRDRCRVINWPGFSIVGKEIGRPKERERDGEMRADRAVRTYTFIN